MNSQEAIYSPETKQEFSRFLEEIIPIDGLSVHEFCEQFGITLLVDKNYLLSNMGLVGKFSAQEFASVLWERSNYGEAEL